MKRKQFTDQEIESAFREARTGIRIEEICSKLGISTPTFYRWRKQFADAGRAAIDGAARADSDSMRLRRQIADLARDRTMLHDMLR